MIKDTDKLDIRTEYDY